MDASTVRSIQVGLPAEYGADAISQKPWQSGIFKFPVEGRVWLDTLNLVGDGQQDLENHGGPYRAILTYSADHYPVWREELARPDLPYGAFGENLTVDGIDETSVCLGDVYAVGEAVVQVTQPRLPCWKLARRWGIKDLTARVEARQWGGWYQRVLQPGYIQAGARYRLLERSYPQFSIRAILQMVKDKGAPPEMLDTLSKIDAFTPSWREWCVDRLKVN
ncbi:MAG: MOSC domain-containing protein [Anaerolineae bacterium]|nr:MOSC domain-containing protein [Anaerolineae bacterium]